MVRQVSYDSGVTWISLDEYQKGDLYENDSPDCGGGITQYKWVNVSGEYTCVGTTKYQKTKKQQSTDGGQTWTDVNPPEYNTGAVIETESSDCGGGSGYENQYLTLVARGSGSFGGIGHNKTYQYSKDEGYTWVNATSATSISVINGERVMFKGTLTNNNYYGVGRFSATTQFEAEGNPMSLVYGDDFRGKTSLVGTHGFLSLFQGCTTLTNINNLKLIATTLVDGCYERMFEGCTSLTSIPNGFLPATTLIDFCYQYMFDDCTSLINIPSGLLLATTLAHACYEHMFARCTSITTAPSLPATTLAEQCYESMFAGCTSLTTAPSLPATTLAGGCYWGMFGGCTSLTTAPVLSATTLAIMCYNYMFGGCTRLNYVKCLATDISASYCTTSWLENVSSSGTFVKASSMSGWTRGTSGIPTNWTVQNA